MERLTWSRSEKHSLVSGPESLLEEHYFRSCPEKKLILFRKKIVYQQTSPLSGDGDTAERCASP